jgi:multiple sugar transport system ATP-binding protein
VIEQIGTPLELYDSPGNVFVAEFIGSPAMNLLPARLKRSGSQRAAMIESGTVIQLPEDFGGEEGQEVLLGIRPEHLSVGDAAGGLSGRVALVEPMGGQVQIVFEVAGRRVMVLLNERILPPLGSELSLRARPAALHAFDAASGRRL